MIHKAIYGRLSTYGPVMTIVGTRIYPVKLPQNPTYPAITYEVITSEGRFSAFGEDAKVNYKRVRIHCWASTHLALLNLKEAVRTAFQRYSGTHNSVVIQVGFIDNEYDLYEDETRIYHYVIDFRIAYEEA